MHRLLSDESYWAAGRLAGDDAWLIERASRVVGLYLDGAQVGFLATVDAPDAGFELPRGRLRPPRTSRPRPRCGAHPLQRSRKARSPRTAWVLHTKDAQELYAKFGFVSGERLGASAALVGLRRNCHSAARAGRAEGATPPIGIRSCASESRSRIVTVSSSSVCSSIVSAERRADLVLTAVAAADRAAVVVLDARSAGAAPRRARAPSRPCPRSCRPAAAPPP